ncbi:DeoR family transcriptional regulator [bacterium]|nr:DeoR family transcriptional regulator [bacterium]
MNKDYFIRLTFAVYRVTQLFPENEPLKFQIRESANEILTNLILISTRNPLTLNFQEREILASRILLEIDSLKHYFDQSQKNNWLKPINFLILKKEYDKIKKLLLRYNQEKEKERKTIIGISPRKKKILEILKRKEKLQVSELQKFFPDVTKRTLRRDLEDLLRRKLIKRIGEWNNIFYKIAG